MTYLRNICLLTLLFSFLLAIPSADAQRKKRKKREDKDKVEVPFTDKLWYGGGFVLGFSGTGGSFNASNQFVIGISPMAGYKVTEKLSFGPRIELNYYTARFQSGSEVLVYNAFNYGIGAFGRIKFAEILFAHAEYGYLNRAIIVDIDSNKFITERQGETQGLIGLGYTAGYPWATEISILYDFLAPEDEIDLPIVFRFGFTYKF